MRDGTLALNPWNMDRIATEPACRGAAWRGAACSSLALRALQATPLQAGRCKQRPLQLIATTVTRKPEHPPLRHDLYAESQGGAEMRSRHRP